jgi:hypothetical protein
MTWLPSRRRVKGPDTHGGLPSEAIMGDPPPEVVALGEGSVAVRGDNLGLIRTETHYHAAIDPTWPVLVGRPPLRADAFLERPVLRQAVNNAFAAGTSLMTQVLAGDGGTGKTQLAAAVFEQARRSLDLAIWVNATTRASVLAAYAQAFATTHPHWSTRGTVDGDRAADAFLAWLANSDRSWIIVLDDVADPEDMRELWPVASPSRAVGRVLVTTRRRDAAIAARGPIIDVDVFTPAESLVYLTEKLRRAPGLPYSALEEAPELAHDLGYLPLALAQAAAVIVNDAITCAHYRALLADRTRTLAEIFPGDPGASGDHYTRTLANTWSLAIDRADALPPRGLAKQVLALAAVLDPNGIPDAVLTGPAASTHMATALGRATARLDAGDNDPRTSGSGPDESYVSPGNARRALRNLHRLSLISHDPNGGVRAVRIHALAQRATLEGLDSSVRAQLVHAAANALLEIWPGIETDLSVGEALRGNADALASTDHGALWDPVPHAMLFRVGESLGQAGLIHEARAYYDALAATSADRVGRNHACALMARAQLAYWRGQAGDLAGALEATAKILADQLRALGPRHSDVLRTRGNMARWRGMAGEPGRAASEFSDLLWDSQAVLEPDHPDTLEIRNELAYWQGQAGNSVGAFNTVSEILEDRLRVLGPDHPQTLKTRANLAYWQGQSGHPAEAAASFARLLADQTQVLGADHPDTLNTRHNLARWRGQSGDPEGAVAESARLLDDRLRVLGPDHPDTLNTRANLAYWQGHARDPAAAATGFARLLDDRRRVLGPDHPDTLNTRGNLGFWQGKAGDPSGAAKAFEDLLPDFLRVLGAGHPHTLNIRHNLAQWRAETGDVAGAVSALSDLLHDRERILGSGHEHTESTRRDLAFWRSRLHQDSPD